MSVKEVLNAIGSFDLDLKADTPKDIITAIGMFGHVAIVPGRIDPRQYEDALLDEARYVGVLREKTVGGQNVSLGGVGMAWHLGDEGTRGAVIEVPATFTAETFPNTITGLLPASVTAGTLYSVPGGYTYTGVHQWQTPRDAIQYVCEYFSHTNAPVSWRVNNNATLDAGPEEDIFVTDPQCIIIRKGAGEDLNIRALPGSFESKLDTEDYTTRVVLLAEGEGASIYLGEATKDPLQNPYKDLHGNALIITRVVSESDTTAENATVRAQLALDSYEGTRAELTLSTKDYDVKGSFSVGDRVYVYDPDAELYDTDFEVIFRGQRLNPIVLKVTETDWPITENYTVAYRANDGTWYDLTDYVEFESDGDSRITVGDFSRQLTSSNTQPIGSRPSVDTSVPDLPTWVEPFQTTNYQDDLGFTRSKVLLTWSAPNNVDGSTVLDGDHYEIQVRVDTDAIYPQSWSSVSSTSWADANSWSQPFTPNESAWQTYYVAWSETTYPINDLATGVGYDVRIRAVDTAGNLGAWRETTIVTTQDNIPPSTPAAPTVAGSLIAVQVVHQLGKATGGTFNLESDLAHLEVHVEYEPYFTPSADTLRGTVKADQGMMTGHIPAVATVPVEETSARYVRVIAVDRAGNKSLPSDAASATALLLDSQYISELTASKITAGTLSANVILGASIQTASSGARVELNQNGLQAFNSAGQQTVSVGTDGNVSIIGTLASGPEGASKRLLVNPSTTNLPEIRFYSTAGTEYGGINGATNSNDDDHEVAMGMFSSTWIPRDGSDTIERHSRIRVTRDGARFEVVKSEDQATNGGFVNLSTTGASIGYGANGVQSVGGVITVNTTDTFVGTNRGTANENTLWLSTDRIRMLGTFADFQTPLSNEALFTGSTDGTSGGSSFSVGFGPTMASQLLPIVAIRDDIVHSNAITASDASGFTLTISPAASGSWAFYYWCFRI
ncbi:hypothetical protein [Streptomyces olivochromogenes]|uniref:Fibronectin type-III domain-containing protein n=1 Tax=Streptomyces olivochromogenes TaxID=1963 RepID=A0A250VL92_STROL|nr:hypothetical protein [Streptomyces olivochromogenes]GAX54750.1 hypothetical protein SO3561_06303 [Streptomyces olivochromogenes]